RREGSGRPAHRRAACGSRSAACRPPESLPPERREGSGRPAHKSRIKACKEPHVAREPRLADHCHRASVEKSQNSIGKRNPSNLSGLEQLMKE
ncbi:unnamed protein product, partial [Staurois parvus]